MEVVSASYLLRQQFRYEYPGPIERLQHRLVVAPPALYGDQRRTEHRLIVSPDVPARWDHDVFGNLVVLIEADRVDHAIQLDYQASIARSAGPGPEIGSAWSHDRRFLTPSTLTVPDRALREAAYDIVASDDCCGTQAEHISSFVFRHMQYVSGVTSVETTAAQAFAQGTGVCQDYAHIMIALCRLSGIPARYVSGHLLGEGGTHAWVEVIEPGPDGRTLRIAGFDPTHDRRTTLSYVFVASGRDYADVAPTSGRFVAPYIGTFTTSRCVDVVEVRYAA